MPFYSPERKNRTAENDACATESFSDMYLFYWRMQVTARGTQLSEAKQPVEKWSAESKLSIIIETSALSEQEIGEYCRRKGICPEQITDWRNAVSAGVMAALIVGATHGKRGSLRLS